MVVPPDTVDGQIRLSTFNDVLGEGAVLTPVHFFVPEPHCDPAFDPTPRSVTLRLVMSLVAWGVVANDAFTACAASVPVKIQRRVAGEWTTVRTHHHEPHRFLQEADPRQARQVPGDGPDVPEWGPYSLLAGYLTRSDQKLIGHWAHREPAPHGDRRW